MTTDERHFAPREPFPPHSWALCLISRWRDWRSAGSRWSRFSAYRHSPCLDIPEIRVPDLLDRLPEDAGCSKLAIKRLRSHLIGSHLVGSHLIDCQACPAENGRDFLPRVPISSRPLLAELFNLHGLLDRFPGQLLGLARWGAPPSVALCAPPLRRGWRGDLEI